MLKYYSLIIGEDPAYTANFHPSSKRKIGLYASCIFLPVILWFINAYLLVDQVLEGGKVIALVTGFIAAFMIFLIERAVIMSKGGGWIATFRILLGFVIALLGSVCMDEVVFKHDIDNQVAKYKDQHLANATASIDTSFSFKIQQQQAIVEAQKSQYQNALGDVSKEADGSGGSGIARVGKITILKQGIADKQKASLDAEEAKLKTLQDSLVSKARAAKVNAEKNFNGSALLLRIKALFDLIQQDYYMLAIYILFTAFIFFIEFLIVIIKLCSDKSIDEELEDARVALINYKAKRTLQTAKQYYDPVFFDHRIQNAQSDLAQIQKGVLSN